MLRPARIASFAVIALAAFGTAASIAAIGDSDQIAVTRYSALEVAPPAPTRADATAAGSVAIADGSGVCSVTLVIGTDGGVDVAPVDLTLAADRSMDLDIPGSSGFSVACGGGTADPLSSGISFDEVPVQKGDLAAL